MVANCAKFHYVAQGVTCNQITSYQHISLDDFVKWNPTVGSDCRSMQAGVNVCVGLIGGTTTTNPPTTTTTAGNGVQTPQPTQPGMVTNCKKFHWVAKGVTCDQIISYQKISLENFVKWNAGVGSDCRTMWAENNVCVGV
ncbi:LysM domain-containing protein, partial [Phaeosphaeria sp. MPI-PUGE-AT-0046c]